MDTISDSRMDTISDSRMFTISDSRMDTISDSTVEWIQFLIQEWIRFLFRHGPRPRPWPWWRHRRPLRRDDVCAPTERVGDEPLSFSPLCQRLPRLMRLWDGVHTKYEERAFLPRIEVERGMNQPSPFVLMALVCCANKINWLMRIMYQRRTSMMQLYKHIDINLSSISVEISYPSTP